jgi:amiloride-sensitive sodium channel subunit alpha
VHNSTSLPSNIDGINAPVGMESNIAIRRTFQYQLAYPFSECLVDLENPSKNKINSYLYEKISKSNYSYSQVFCFDQYYEQMVIDKCKCYDLVYVNLLDAPKPCLTMEEIECSDGVFYEFIHMDINKIAGSLCPLECNTITYDTISSYTQFPSKTYADILLHKPEVISVFKNDSNLTYEKLKENIVRVNMYYETTKYTVIVESPTITIIGLLSNIGGTMGLFMVSKVY